MQDICSDQRGRVKHSHWKGLEVLHSTIKKEGDRVSPLQHHSPNPGTLPNLLPEAKAPVGLMDGPAFTVLNGHLDLIQQNQSNVFIFTCKRKCGYADIQAAEDLVAALLQSAVAHSYNWAGWVRGEGMTDTKKARKRSGIAHLRKSGWDWMADQGGAAGSGEGST